MQALEKGELEEIERLSPACLAAGQPDLFLVLLLVSFEPDAIDPSHFRNQAKKLGVANGPGLPTLDLIRLFAAAMANAKASRPATLATLSRERPVLFALLPLLSGKFRAYHAEKTLLPLSRRLAEYWAMGVACQTGRKDPRAFVREHVPGAKAPFAPEDWPDLGRERGRRDRIDLERWLASSPPPAWCEHLAVEAAALRYAPRDRRRRVLGTLLERIGEILREGRPVEARGPVLAALQLADSLEGISSKVTLILQLGCLSARLDWWQPVGGRSIEFLLSLWSELRSASSAERTAVATRVLEDEEAAAELPGHLRAELALAIVGGTSELDRSIDILEAWGEDIPPAALAKSLTALTDRARAELLLGLHEVGRGELAFACIALRGCSRSPAARSTGCALHRRSSKMRTKDRPAAASAARSRPSSRPSNLTRPRSSSRPYSPIASRSS